nr:nucleoside-triphosphatase [uncultured Psychroserpens sp.]
MIYILTGNVRTGKTSALLDWCNGRYDVDGVLCPDDDKGERYFLNIKSKDTYPLEIQKGVDNSQIVSVGPFRFLKSSFQKANEYLIDVNDKRAYNYVIIDELGKLELKNIGLHESAITIINSYQLNLNHHLILVVRTSLLEHIIRHYKISKYQLLDKKDLTKLI